MISKQINKTLSIFKMNKEEFATIISVGVIGVVAYLIMTKNIKLPERFTDSKNNGLIQQKYTGVVINSSSTNAKNSIDGSSKIVNSINYLTGNSEIASNSFSYEWSGYINPPKSGDYTFNITSSGSSYVHIKTDKTGGPKGKMIVNNSNGKQDGIVTLEAGISYPITIGMSHKTGDSAYVTFSWKGGDQLTETTSLDIFSTTDYITNGTSSSSDSTTTSKSTDTTDTNTSTSTSGTTNTGTTNTGTTNTNTSTSTSGTTNTGTTNTGTTNTNTSNSGTTNTNTSNSGTTDTNTSNSGTTDTNTSNSGTNNTNTYSSGSSEIQNQPTSNSKGGLSFTTILLIIFPILITLGIIFYFYTTRFNNRIFP